MPDTTTGDTAPVLDVRDMAPRIRHPKIFETFDTLAPGQGFVLVNDHDPRPLLYQFQFERANTFGWRYLEEGPEVWRVEITKRPAPFTESVTVSEASRDANSLRVLQRLGINHCCGAHLTLREAGAAAGVPVETLLRELDEARGAAK